eukprot:3231773-Prymnesium_polylepis.1
MRWSCATLPVSYWWWWDRGAVAHLHLRRRARVGGAQKILDPTPQGTVASLWLKRRGSMNGVSVCVEIDAI